MPSARDIIDKFVGIHAYSTSSGGMKTIGSIGSHTMLVMELPLNEHEGRGWLRKVCLELEVREGSGLVSVYCGSDKIGEIPVNRSTGSLMMDPLDQQAARISVVAHAYPPGSLVLGGAVTAAILPVMPSAVDLLALLAEA